jgi:hypothetical protein
MGNPPFTGKELKGAISGPLWSGIDGRGNFKWCEQKQKKKRSYEKVVPGFEPGLPEIK